MADESAKLENSTEVTRQVRKGRSRFIALARAFGGAQAAPHDRGPKWTKRVLCQIGRWMLRLRYRVRLEGMQAIQEKGRTGILFLPNHPALIDPPIVVTYLYQHFAVRPLAATGAINQPLVRTLAKMVDVRACDKINVRFWHFFR
ncbi:MAG: hypothetical protein ACP5I8_16855 [Phycisphaerae bacterium]